MVLTPTQRTTHPARTRIQRAWPTLEWRRRDLRHLHGPFDIVGDVHGCHAELVQLLRSLDYDFPDGDRAAPVPPRGRTLVFAGDLVDRGPASDRVLELVRGMLLAGTAIVTVGNHDDRLVDYVNGRDCPLGWGLDDTLRQVAPLGTAYLRDAAAMLDALPAHVVLAGGALVVSHAGIRAASLADVDSSPAEPDDVRARALHGEFTGATDEHGSPERCFGWLDEPREGFELVYGHTPVAHPRWHNGSIDIDTGCVYGGGLTALRWPERTLRHVPSAGR